MVFHRKYRLIGIKSTTPEDLYSRKIALEVNIYYSSILSKIFKFLK